MFILWYYIILGILGLASFTYAITATDSTLNKLRNLFQCESVRIHPNADDCAEVRSSVTFRSFFNARIVVNLLLGRILVLILHIIIFYEELIMASTFVLSEFLLLKHYFYRHLCSAQVMLTCTTLSTLTPTPKTLVVVSLLFCFIVPRMLSPPFGFKLYEYVATNYIVCSAVEYQIKGFLY